MLSRFHRIPERERNGRTDRRTDKITILISLVSVLTRDKKGDVLYHRVQFYKGHVGLLIT